MFDAWTAAALGAVGVHAVQLPGREGRYAEPPVDRLHSVVVGVADALERASLGPTAVFGHSLGALLAFELARELRRRRAPNPVALLVSSYRAPHLPDRLPQLRHLSTSALARELVQRYGASTELLHSPELMALMAPVIQADLTLSETYVFAPEPPLACPIRAYRGARDPNVTDGEARGWAHHTCAGFALRVHAGSHHLPRGSESAVLALVRDDLQRVLCSW